MKKTPSQPSQTSQKIFCDSSFVGHLLRREKQPDRYEHWDDTTLANIEAASLTISIVTIAEIRAAWIEHQVPQCGYCQSGMIMAVSALLAKNPSPSDSDLGAAITNICRCGTYPRIRAAVRSLATARG